MSYLFCEKCWGYYQLQPGESREDFESCRCGGALIEVEDIGDLLNSLESDLVGTEKSIDTSDIERLEKNKDVIGLIDVLKYGNPESRAYATISLGRLRNERAFQHLLDAINDEDPIVRANAMVALSNFKNKKFLEIILPEIHDENYKVREGKIKAFERMGGDVAFENIVKGLKDEHHVVRIRAAMSLGNLGDKRAV